MPTTSKNGISRAAGSTTDAIGMTEVRRSKGIAVVQTGRAEECVFAMSL